MADDEVLALADRLFKAIEAKDLDAVRALYAPDIVVWANFNDRGQDVERALRSLGWLLERLAEPRYDVRRRDEIPGGFLQEHVLCGVAPDGSPVAMPACIVAKVEGGLITSINEYLDPAGVAALSA